MSAAEDSAAAQDSAAAEDSAAGGSADEFLDKVSPAAEAPLADEAPPPDEAGLADEAPPVDPAAELTRPALEGLSRRYAASRGLAWTAESAPAWRDPGPWFLSSLDITRSFGLMHGGIGGGPDGELWYAEEAARGPGGSRERWIVARYEIAPARRAGAIACAVRRRHSLPVLGLLQDGPLPRGLTEAPTGDEQFDQRYVVGTGGGDLVDGERPWADRLFTAEFTGWLLGQPYGEHGTSATCFQLQGGRCCVYAAGWPGTADELDAFCGRAARIAAEVAGVTREASQQARPDLPGPVRNKWIDFCACARFPRRGPRLMMAP